MKSDSREVNVTAYVLKQLTNRIPSTSNKQLKLPENLEMADPHYHVSKPVNMIPGVDVFEELIESQREEVSPGLFLRKTIYGWVVLGKQEGATENNATCHFSLVETLRKFWEIESLSKQTVLTEEEIKCERLFQETTKVVTNRFVVKLPFKKNSKLDESLTQAQR